MDTREAAKATDTLIRRLADDAGGPSRPRRLFFPRLLASTCLSLTLAVLVVAGVFGFRDDLATHASSMMFAFKLAATACIAIAGLALAYASGTPGLRIRVVMGLLPAAVVLASGLAVLDGGVTLLGVRQISVPVCLAAIVLSALPGLALLLLALRRATPTRPTLAGAMAGLLAGALGAMAYTLSCLNDGAGFVSLWYSLGILLSSAIGAMAGRRLLAW